VGWQPGSPGRTRTSDQVVNSHPLYQLSYRGISGIIILNHIAEMSIIFLDERDIW
jgi:hypothetical protein